MERMPRQDTVDFLTAFAVGTVLGIGATLLLQPQRTPKQRVIRQLKPYRKQMKRSYSQAREAVRDGRAATGDLTSEVISAGRELLGEFRSEVADILGDARQEIQKMVKDQVKDLSHGAKRTRRRMGM
jgi:gas vesicle protein